MTHLNTQPETPEAPEAIGAPDLDGVAGGGLFGHAWKLAKGGAHVAKAVYHDVKPVASKVAPFAMAASQLHNIVNRAKHDL